MSKPISIQLYTVRKLAAKDFASTLRQIAGIGYAGVEFAGLHGMPAADVAALVRELGLKPSSAHVPMPTRENIEALAKDAKTIGYTHIISGSDPSKLKTLADVEACAQQYREASELAAAHGLTVGLHNHWWELDHLIDGQTPYDRILAQAPAIFSELDVYWCTTAGQSVPNLIRRHAARIPLLHIKDGDVTPTTPHKAVGRGKLDFATIVAAADPSVLKWLIVELDDCATDMLEAVAQSYEYLTTSGLGHGRK